MRVLITGGTGFLGRATVAALTGAGHSVRTIVRDRRRVPGAWSAATPTVEIVEGDPSDRAAMTAALAGMDAVAHIAAAYTYDRGATATMSANANLTRTVLEAARDSGVRCLVDVSSLVVFSLAARHLDPATPLTQPGEPGWSDAYLRSKVEAEVVGREIEAAGLPRVTVHPGQIVGPDDVAIGPSGQYLVAFLRGGSLPDTWAPWVDVRDVARGIALALDAPVGSHYLMTAGVFAHRDTAAILDDLTGRHPGRRFLSPGTVRRLARLNDLFGGRLGDIPEAERLDFLLGSARSVDTSATERELGLQFRPFRESAADAIRWWAANGTIDPKLAGRLAEQGG